MSGRFILVELEEDLTAHRTTRHGVWACLRQTPGVRGVIDLACVSQPTLDAILLKPTEQLKREDPSTYNAIRQHHRRKQQPRLDLEP